MKRIQNMKDKYKDVYDEEPPKEIRYTEIDNKPSEPMFPKVRLFTLKHLLEKPLL